jgi:hypothetical protein
MGRLNVEPMILFRDGAQLVVSTRYSGEGRFVCELYLRNPNDKEDRWSLQVVSDLLEAPTCREAQEIAYCCAKRLYPTMTAGIKEPPYLIWPGPNLPVGPDNRWRRSVQQ